ncbi:hypothetical protein, partial [Photobacterium sanctipauli]
SVVRHERLGCWSYDSWSAFSQSQGESITVSLNELIDEVEQSEVEVIYGKLLKARDKMADLSLFLSEKLNGSSSYVLVMSEKIGNLMLGLVDSWHLHSGKIQTNDINIVNDENKAIDTLTKDQSSKSSNYITKNNTHKVLVEDISIS